MGKHTEKQRFSIRKYTFGAGSVLIGLSLYFAVDSAKVEAAEAIANIPSSIGHMTDSEKIMIKMKWMKPIQIVT